MQKTNFVSGILIAIVGLLLLIIPDQIVKIIVFVLGVEAVINGVYTLVYMREFLKERLFRAAILTRGAGSVIVGLLAICLPLVFAEAMWTMMLYVLAFYLIFAAILELYIVAKLRDTAIDRKLFVLEAIISIIVAVILFLLPQQIGALVLRVLGALVMLVGLVHIYVTIRDQKIEKAIDEAVVESVVVEDDKESEN